MGWNVTALIEYCVDEAWTMDAPVRRRKHRKRRQVATDASLLRSTPVHIWYKDRPLASLLTACDPDGNGPAAIAPHRGLPGDASASASAYCDAMLNEVTWMTGQEVLDYPLWDVVPDDAGPRSLNLGQFAAGLESGFDPRIARGGSRCIGIGGESPRKRCEGSSRGSAEHAPRSPCGDRWRVARVRPKPGAEPIQTDLRSPECTRPRPAGTPEPATFAGAFWRWSMTP